MQGGCKPIPPACLGLFLLAVIWATTYALVSSPASESLSSASVGVQDGDVQLWSLTLAAMVDSVPCGDSVLCAAAVDR